MIKLTVVNDQRQLFVVSGDEPFRVEIAHNDSRVFAHVYRGEQRDENDEPVGAYDGTLHDNKDWVV